jgi:hypothetical protein
MEDLGHQRFHRAGPTPDGPSQHLQAATHDARPELLEEVADLGAALDELRDKATRRRLRRP